jgi:Mn-containing catalase
MSSGNAIRGPWNQGQTTQTGETLQYIEDPIKHVLETNSLLDQKPTSEITQKQNDTVEQELSKLRSTLVNTAAPIGPQQWNKPLSDDDLEVNTAALKAKS